MHELPIAQGILESVLRHAADSNAARVTTIYLVIGDLSGVASECVEFYWDALSQGTPAHGAAIHVRRVPFEMTCLDCAHAFNPTGVAFGYDCPVCGASRVKMSHGQECYLEAIDVDQDHADLAKVDQDHADQAKVDQAVVRQADDAQTGRDPSIESRTSS